MKHPLPIGLKTPQAIASARPIFPRWFVIGVGLLVVGTLCLTLVLRNGQAIARYQLHTDPTRVVAQRQLLFQDTAGGSVTVIDAQSGHPITQLGVGEDGFIRSVMRGLARQRRALGAGPQTPFILTAWQSGSVSLLDPVNGHRVELTAFGPDNTAAFTRLLERDT